MSISVGLDIGTNLLVSGKVNDGGAPVFKTQRDAFYRIIPKSKVNKNSIRLSLEKRGANFIVDNDDSLIVVGEEALEIAIERNDVAQRPLRRGVISPRDKHSLPMLQLIIENLIGKGEQGDSVIYSVPAKPIDSFFDITYHMEMMGMYLGKLGYTTLPINEAFAVALSELLDDGLTGICISWGAGMSNIVVVQEGDPLIEFSVTKAGDYIDQAVGNALDVSPSLIQLEKEAGTNLFNPTTKIMEAVSVYYSTVINYTFQNIVYELNKRKKELPIFRNPVTVIVSGGLSKADGFVKKVEEVLGSMEFPIKIKEVKRAKDPLTAVANGACIASQLER